MIDVVETRYGTMECLQSDTVVSKSLALYGEWAQDELALLAKFLHQGDVALDVGAFLGTHTLALARAVGTTGIVHSFEPRVGIREFLSANVLRNELTQVYVHGCALSNAAREMGIIAVDIHSDRNFGGLAIVHSGDRSEANTELILLRTLDEFAFPRIDLIKIDAEGMEADVLVGGGQSITRHQPLIFAECNDLELGSRTWRLLKEYGYDVYGFLSKAFNRDNWRRETENVFGEAAEASLLGIPPRWKNRLPSEFDAKVLPLIESLDDLALLMLHKPQYPEEIWRGTNAGDVLGLAFESPRTRQLNVQIESAQAELDAANRRLNAAVDHHAAVQQALTTELDRLRVLTEEQQRRIHELDAYRRTSVGYAWQRLTGRNR